MSLFVVTEHDPKDIGLLECRLVSLNKRAEFQIHIHPRPHVEIAWEI